nr:23S rRNA (adenine(2503)-C(2))-methyltransferase RlmN [Treponema brennaborense]
MDKISVAGLLPEELSALPGVSPQFRGKQIFKWLGNGAASFQEMRNLPQHLRDSLSETAAVRSSQIAQELRDPDGTVKLQITLHDGACIETVLLTDSSGRKTACVSCQAGCAMGCAFCQTGKLGLARNLDAAEIVEQFLYLEQVSGKLDNIVFMGMGEPMMNLSAVRKAVAVLTHPEGRGLSARRITVSTSGIIKGIYDLADNGPHMRLAVSLTTADPELRERLMPVTKGNPLPELQKAIAYYTEKSKKRCTLEAALLAGMNTGTASAERLIEFARGLDVHINLIPWNPVPGLPFAEPSAAECTAFVRLLEKARLNVTLRTRRGRKIGGACGQLGKITVE